METNLAPNFQFLRDMGISKSDLVNVILLHPILISLKVQKLKAWESLFGSRETLLKNLRRSSWFLSNSIDNVVRPNRNFLRDECGITEEQVSLIFRRHPTFIVQSLDSLRGFGR